MKSPKLGRKTDNRNRTLRNLVTGLVLYEKIRTTEAKAKAIVPMTERLLTRSRTGTLTARRNAKALLFDQNAVTKLFEDFPERYGSRTSGFTRVTKLAPRPGDGSEMALIELLLTPIEEVIAKETNTKVAVRKTKKTEEAATTEESAS